MQERLPGGRRCGDLQSRIPVALLRIQSPPAERAGAANFDLWAQRRLARSRPGESGHATSRPARSGKASRRNILPSAAFRPSRQKLSSNGGRSSVAPASRRRFRAGVSPAQRTASIGTTSCSGPTPSTTTSSPRPPKPPPKFSKPPASTFIVPRAHLCCGRPLYDVGMLDRAKALLLQIMDELLAGNRSAHAHRGPRAELRRRLPRRTHQPLPERRTRPRPLEASLPAQRIPRAVRQETSPSPNWPAKR